MIFYYHTNKAHFHKKGFAPGLVLRVRFLELGNGLFIDVFISWFIFLVSLSFSCLYVRLIINKLVHPFIDIDIVLFTHEELRSRSSLKRSREIKRTKIQKES